MVLVSCLIAAHTWRLGSLPGVGHTPAQTWHLGCAEVLPHWWPHPCAQVVLGSCLCATPTGYLGCLPGGLAHPSARMVFGHAKTQLSLSSACCRTQNSIELLAVQGPKYPTFLKNKR